MKSEKKRKGNYSPLGCGITTESVHAGEAHGLYGDSLTQPVFLTSTYVFKNTDDIEAFTSRKNRRFEYGRYGNPTQQAAERKLAVLEGAETCLLFDSGMSAITTSLLTFLHQGSHVITTDDAYKKTLLFCDKWLPGFGIERTIVKMGDSAAMAAAIKKNTAVVIVESPTNPYLNVLDFDFLKKLKKKHPGVVFIVDSTFGTPYNQRPIEYGADLVIHSVTKYLGGHNDLMGGAVLGGAGLIGKIAATQQMMGGIIDPHGSYLLIRGLKSFSLRMEKQNKSGIDVAEFLEAQSKVKRVYYPGLSSHPHHCVAKRQMKGFGGVVTFEIDCDTKGVKRFLNALRLCLLAPSLGGAESLVSHPASMSYYDYGREERLRLGITDGLIRLSIGIEAVEDIKADLAGALKKI